MADFVSSDWARAGLAARTATTARASERRVIVISCAGEVGSPRDNHPPASRGRSFITLSCTPAKIFGGGLFRGEPGRVLFGCDLTARCAISPLFVDFPVRCPNGPQDPGRRKARGGPRVQNTSEPERVRHRH